MSRSRDFRRGEDAYDPSYDTTEEIQRMNPYTNGDCPGTPQQLLEPALQWFAGWQHASEKYGNMSITEIERSKHREKALQDYYPGKDLDDCENLEEVKAWIKENLC
jgi:hypothetical protein